MIFEIKISEQADADLRGIFEYIAFELQSPENTSGQLDRLEESIMKPLKGEVALRLRELIRQGCEAR